MGMYDYIRCDYPLPGNPKVDEWQTKYTPAQALETYIINADGRLQHEEVDYVDRSNPNAEGLDRLVGMATPENHRIVDEPDFRGEIVFCGDDDSGVRWRFSALFDCGKLLNIKQIEPYP